MPSSDFIRIGRRLSRALIGVVTLVLLTFAAAAIWFNAAGAQRQLEARLASSMQIAETSLAEPLWNFDHDTVANVLEAMLLEESVVYADVIEPGDDFDGAAGAFMDTAALMMNLDLIVTSDTAIPHLAGALGVQVWLALPFLPDWRGLLDREDSPWYPSMRLFRQPAIGDWDTPLANIAKALQEIISNAAQ